MTGSLAAAPRTRAPIPAAEQRQPARTGGEAEAVELGPELELARSLGEEARNRSHRQVRGDVSGLMTAGPIRNHVQLQIVAHQRDVLVVVAAPARIGLGCCFEPELTCLRARGFAHEDASLTRAPREFRW